MEILSSRVICHSGDIAGLRRFYEQVLELRIYREYGRQPAGGFTGVVYFLGGGYLEIAASERPSPPLTLWLQVPDVTAEAVRLAAAGVEVVKEAERMPWGLIELWVHDPHGNELRIIEVPEDHPLRRRA